MQELGTGRNSIKCLRAQGAKTQSGAGIFSLPPCLYIVTAQATVTAKRGC